jgi:hypothetical protein
VASEEELCPLGVAILLRNEYTTIQLSFVAVIKTSGMFYFEIGTGPISTFCGPDVECKNRWCV